jgi:hypothetical protein
VKAVRGGVCFANSTVRPRSLTRVVWMVIQTFASLFTQKHNQQTTTNNRKREQTTTNNNNHKQTTTNNNKRK